MYIGYIRGISCTNLSQFNLHVYTSNKINASGCKSSCLSQYFLSVEKRATDVRERQQVRQHSARCPLLPGIAGIPHRHHIRLR